MYCKNCGALLDDDAVFCEKCGTVVKRKSVQTDENESSIVSETTVPGDIAEINGDQESVPGAFAQPSPDQNNYERDGVGHKKSKLKVGIIAGAAVVVIAILALLVFKGGLFGSNQGSFDARAESNYNGGGQFAYDSSKLYIVGKMNDSDEETSLYSTSYTGTNKTTISDNSDISRIRIVGGRILYNTYKDSKYSLGVMDVNGANNTVIKESLDSLGDYDMVSDVVYYVSNKKLFSCKSNGEDNQELLNGVVEFVLVGNTIYYCTDSSIYKYDIKKNESSEICSQTGTQLNYDSNKIYFKNDKGIYYVETSGNATAQQIVRDSEVGKYLINGTNIYYIQTLTTDEIKAIANAIDEENALTYQLALIGAGMVKSVPKDGGAASDVETDEIVFFSLYAYPNGYYSKMTVWADTVKAVDIK